MHTNYKQIFRAFILVPFLATSMSISTFQAAVDTAIKQQIEDKAAVQAQIEREELAEKINAYFAQYDLPIAGHGMTMVIAGETYGIDPLLIAGLAMRESTGCKFIIPNTYNCFGWGGGKIKFKSFDEAIEVIAKNLGGHNERTAHYYKGKDIRGILETYNPPSVVKTYADEVIRIMDRIEKIELASA